MASFFSHSKNEATYRLTELFFHGRSISGFFPTKFFHHINNSNHASTQTSKHCQHDDKIYFLLWFSVKKKFENLGIKLN